MRARAPLRFGVVALVTGEVRTWRDQLRGLTDSGYSTILMPDVLAWQPAPAPALAVAGLAEVSRADGAAHRAAG